MVTGRRRFEGLVRSGACRCRNVARLSVYGVVCALAVLLLCAHPAVGATRNVPSEDYATIQAVINAAADGDTVVVAVGTYVENINFNGKAITVTSTNPLVPSVVADTIIDGGGSGTVVLFNHGETTASVLTGFTIQHGKAINGGGIRCQSSSPTITKNVITGNSATGWEWSSGGGIDCRTDSSPTIEDNRINGNTAGHGGGAICCNQNSSPPITGNTFTGNTARGGGAIYCGWNSSPPITGNTFTRNTASGGGAIYCSRNSSPPITGNTFTGNTATAAGGAIECWNSCSPTIQDNTISDNSARIGGAIECWDSCSPEIIGNEITGNSAQDEGGAIFCGQNSSPPITGNTFTGNTASGGGAIHSSQNSSPPITGNTFTGNTATAGGAIKCWFNCSPRIADNTFVDNVGVQGGAIAFWDFCSPEIIGNEMRNNSAVGSAELWSGGGAIRFGSTCSPTIADNLIVGNSAVGNQWSMGGAMFFGGPSSPTITGNEITGNSAQGSAGGISATQCSPHIEGNTIAGNSGDGILCRRLGSPTITGNVIYDNTLWGIKCEDSAATNAASLEDDNTLGTNGSGQVLQCWHGLVKVMLGDGTPADGASVTILDDDGDTTPDYGSPFTTSAEGIAPDTADPGSWGTCPAITEFEVGNDGVRKYLTPQTILASLAAVSGAVTHRWNGPDQIAKVVLNNLLVVGNITGPEEPVSVGTTISVSAEFTDAHLGDAHTAEWDWGDESSDTVEAAVSPVRGTHSYDTPGVYTVTLTVTNAAGASDSASFQYVVVYEASAGFVTGGGWIDSPAGAYAADASLAGKANFGFVAKYKKGATTPSGQTQFRFRAGDLDFYGTEYQWLVVAGPQAKFKGVGTINGEGEYGFMLTARDGQVSGGGRVDKFRIKIWDKATDEVVYDNQMDQPDDSDAGTEIGGGNIVIHGEK